MGLGTAERAALLDAAAEALAADHDSAAGPPLDALFADLDPADPGDLTYQIFGQALARRAGRGAPDVNLYLRDLKLRQISLFNLIATHLPFVRRSGQFTNDVLAGVLADADQVILVDVGIGTGQQEFTVLEALARLDRLPRRLSVIGIEPSPSILADAERTFARARDEFGVDVTFTGVLSVAEAMTDHQWDELPVGDDVVVNAAFAMHHIQATGDGPAAARDHVFRRIRALDPRVMTLIEPNSNHLEPDFLVRFRNCWEHFGAAMQAIDASPATVTERLAMKMFFAREVDDVIANAEETRAERHERTEAWMQRLDRTGFGLVGGLPSDPRGDQLTVDRAEGWVRMGYDGTPMVACIFASRQDADLGALGWNDLGAGDGPAATTAPVFATDPGRYGASVQRVRDIMQSEITSISLGATLADAARLLRDTRVSDLAVTGESGAFVGVLAEGDLIRTLLPGESGFEGDVAESFEVLAINGRARAGDAIDDLVIREPVPIAPSDDLLRVASVMVERQIRRLHVVEDGRLVGTVSRADLVTALLSG